MMISVDLVYTHLCTHSIHKRTSEKATSRFLLSFTFGT